MTYRTKLDDAAIHFERESYGEAVIYCLVNNYDLNVIELEKIDEI